MATIAVLNEVFVREARSAFDFLTTSHGFRCVGETGGLVCYKSSAGSVHITWEPPQNDVQIELHPVFFGLTVWCIGYTLLMRWKWRGKSGETWPFSVSQMIRSR